MTVTKEADMGTKARKPATPPGPSRQAHHATPRRIRGAVLRPHVRHRRTPTHALAGTSEHPEAIARPCRRVQSRSAHAESIRPRHAARAARTPVRSRRAWNRLRNVCRVRVDGHPASLVHLATDAGASRVPIQPSRSH